MRVLLTGANGQVGWELARLLPAVGEVLAFDRRQLDLDDLGGLRRLIRELRPQVIVNAAAYTSVDQAESEPAIARRINATAVAVMAEELQRISGCLVHYSTDYVFDGTKSGPYTEEDIPNPINAYGVSKREGEKAIQQIGVSHMIFRTSWAYAARGKNFLLTMLRLFDQRPELKIIADQIGAPTWCRWIAQQTVEAIRRRQLEARTEEGFHWNGIFHMTAAGATSWYGFASAIRERRYVGPGGTAPRLVPVTTPEYPTLAKRPQNSVLSNAKLVANSGMKQPSWESLLAGCMSDLSDVHVPAKKTCDS